MEIRDYETDSEANYNSDNDVDSDMETMLYSQLYHNNDSYAPPQLATENELFLDQQSVAEEQENGVEKSVLNGEFKEKRQHGTENEVKVVVKSRLDEKVVEKKAQKTESENNSEEVSSKKRKFKYLEYLKGILSSSDDSEDEGDGEVNVSNLYVHVTDGTEPKDAKRFKMEEKEALKSSKKKENDEEKKKSKKNKKDKEEKSIKKDKVKKSMKKDKEETSMKKKKDKEEKSIKTDKEEKSINKKKEKEEKRLKKMKEKEEKRLKKMKKKEEKRLKKMKEEKRLKKKKNKGEKGEKIKKDKEKSKTKGKYKEKTVDLDESDLRSACRNAMLDFYSNAFCVFPKNTKWNSNWNVTSLDLTVFSKRNNRGRFFNVCEACGKTGHERRGCPAVQLKCLLCGDGHHMEACDKDPCRNCWLLDHKSGDCMRKKQTYINCNRCMQRGHSASFCPQIWRQFHLLINPENIIRNGVGQIKPLQDAYCYACGKKGHFGLTCVHNFFNSSVSFARLRENSRYEHFAGKSFAQKRESNSRKPKILQFDRKQPQNLKLLRTARTVQKAYDNKCEDDHSVQNLVKEKNEKKIQQAIDVWQKVFNYSCTYSNDNATKNVN